MKVSATGNDFIIMLRASCPEPGVRWNLIAAHVCNPQHGIGSDGLIVLDGSAPVADMDFYNPDGSRPAVCGNGLRASAWFLYREMQGPSERRIRAADGLHDTLAHNRRASVIMHYERRRPRLLTAVCPEGKLAGHLTTAGVPHFVARVDRLGDDRWRALGCALRSAAVFGSAGANINLWAPMASGRIRLRTFERGITPGETRACGSGAVAVARVVTDRHDYKWPVTLRPMGGVLTVREPEKPGRTWLDGSVTELFRGTISVTVRMGTV